MKLVARPGNRPPMKKWLNSENAVTFGLMAGAVIFGIWFTPILFGWLNKAKAKVAPTTQ
jgi:hypothetical protein